MLSIGADDDDGETATGRAAPKSNGASHAIAAKAASTKASGTVTSNGSGTASFGSFRQGAK